MGGKATGTLASILRHWDLKVPARSAATARTASAKNRRGTCSTPWRGQALAAETGLSVPKIQQSFFLKLLEVEFYL